MYLLLLLFENNNLLLGYVPETAGLLIFGLALIAVTVFLRWFFKEKEAEKLKEENLETPVKRMNRK